MSYPHFSTDCEDFHPEAFAAHREWKQRPTVVCICGSMRFMAAMLIAGREESLAGRIVVLPLVNMKDFDYRWQTEDQQERIKTELDALHLKKIDLADEVLIVNVGGYIGDSTRREIEYAEKIHKPVLYLEPLNTEVPA